MAKSSSIRKGAKTKKFERRQMQTCLAPPKGLVYPGHPIVYSNTERLRWLLYLLAGMNTDIGDMELQQRVQDIGRMPVEVVRDTLRLNGFRILKRKELQSVRVKQNELQASAWVRLRQAGYMGSGGEEIGVCTRVA